MKTWGVKAENGKWVIDSSGMMFWSVSYQCALAFALQNNRPPDCVQSFEDSDGCPSESELSTKHFPKERLKKGLLFIANHVAMAWRSRCNTESSLCEISILSVMREVARMLDEIGCDRASVGSNAIDVLHVSDDFFASLRGPQ